MIRVSRFFVTGGGQCKTWFIWTSKFVPEDWGNAKATIADKGIQTIINSISETEEYLRSTIVFFGMRMHQLLYDAGI